MDWYCTIYSFKICAFDIVLSVISRESKMEAWQGESFVYYFHYSKAMHVHQYELISIVKNVFYLDMFQTLNENNILVFFSVARSF